MNKKNKISESVFSSKYTTIPMADVLYIEKEYENYDSADKTQKKGDFRGCRIIMKDSKWNFSYDTWENAPSLIKKEAEKFISAWCYYRYEIEGGEEVFHSISDKKYDNDIDKQKEELYKMKQEANEIRNKIKEL